MKPLTVFGIATTCGALWANSVNYDNSTFRIAIMIILALMLVYWIWIGVGENRHRRNMQNLMNEMAQQIIKARKDQ